MDMIRSTGRRRNTRNETDRLLDADDDEIAELIDELAKDDELARGFRRHAHATQMTENRILSHYEAFLTVLKVMPRDKTALTESERHLILFPTEENQLCLQLRKYMHFMARIGSGRRAGSRISVGALQTYRMALVFWVYHTHENMRPRVAVIPKWRLYHQLSQAIASAAHKHQLPKHGALNRSEVGLAELRQLIDHDLTSTANIALAESHQLAWLLGRTCAVRPGSIGPSNKDKLKKMEYLVWKDLDIIQGTEFGKFEVMITFRSLKSNSPDAQKALKRGVQMRTLKCKVLSPKHTNNLIFSIPHRLLVIALRRGILDGIDTLEDLFAWKKHHIRVKTEFLEKPVVLASGPRGLSLSKEPASVMRLTEYLRTRGERVGFPDPITFYSLRRRSATDLTRKIGPDAARLIMNHDPDSRTLEEYYLNLSPTTDLTAITLGESCSADGQSTDLQARNHHQAIYALKDTALRRVHGSALNALMRKIIATDPECPTTASELEMKYYQRRVRKVASEVLFSEEVQKQRELMTQTEYQQRVALLEHSDLTRKILERAGQILGDVSLQQEVNRDENVADSTAEVGSEALLDEDIAAEIAAEEEDLEDQPPGDGAGTLRQSEMGNDVQPVLRAADEEEQVEEESVKAIPYLTAAKAFMDVLLSNAMSKHHDFKNNPVPCPLCEEDETISHDTKAKTYSSESHLNDHMESITHTPKAKWKRTQQISHQSSSSDRFICPYCFAVNPEAPKEYANLKALMVHVEASNELNFGDLHDEMKKEDGWYDQGWAENTSERKKKRTSQERALRRRYVIRDSGLDYSNEMELDLAQPHPTTSKIVMGGPLRNEANVRGIATNLSMDSEQVETIPKWLAHKVTAGTISDDIPVGDKQNLVQEDSGLTLHFATKR